MNKILETNQSSRHLLQRYAGNTFSINSSGIKLAVQIDSDGFLIVPTTTDYTVTITIPLAIATYMIDRDKLAAVRKITFAGDSKFGLELLEIIANLQFTGLYTNDSPVQTLILQRLVSFISLIKRYIQKLAVNAAVSSSEYLMYESGDIVNRFTLEQFYTEVDKLKSQVDCLSKKIGLLSAKLS